MAHYYEELSTNICIFIWFWILIWKRPRTMAFLNIIWFYFIIMAVEQQKNGKKIVAGFECSDSVAEKNIYTSRGHLDSYHLVIKMYNILITMKNA